MKKTVYLIRHAQGHHNVNEDYTIVDAELTKLGYQQIEKTKMELDKVNFDLILVSPLRRTLQTAYGLFGESKMIAIEDVREYRYNPCDFRIELSKTKDNFKNIDFSQISDKDPFTKKENDEEMISRCKKFNKYLESLDSRKIAIVTHFGFIEHFMKVCKGKYNIQLDNCKYIKIN